MEMPKLQIKAPAASARCAQCGSGEVSSLPFFALGCGQVYRAIADDVICRRCGYTGQPVYKGSGNAKPPAAGTQAGAKSAEQKPPKSE